MCPRGKNVNRSEDRSTRDSSHYSLRLILEANPTAGVGVPPIELSSRSKMPQESVVNLTISSCLKQGIDSIKVAGGLSITRKTY